MNDEYVYFQITRDDDGVRSSFAHFESMISPCMLDAAIVGIRYSDLDAYYERSEDAPEAEVLRGWFIVKAWDGISREDIAEAIKYG